VLQGSTAVSRSLTSKRKADMLQTMPLWPPTAGLPHTPSLSHEHARTCQLTCVLLSWGSRCGNGVHRCKHSMGGALVHWVHLGSRFGTMPNLNLIWGSGSGVAWPVHLNLRHGSSLNWVHKVCELDCGQSNSGTVVTEKCRMSEHNTKTLDEVRNGEEYSVWLRGTRTWSKEVGNFLLLKSMKYRLFMLRSLYLKRKEQRK